MKSFIQTDRQTELLLEVLADLIKDNSKQGIHLVDNFPNIQLVIVLGIKSWVREAIIMIIKNQEF